MGKERIQLFVLAPIMRFLGVHYQEFEIKSSAKAELNDDALATAKKALSIKPTDKDVKDSSEYSVVKVTVVEEKKKWEIRPEPEIIAQELHRGNTVRVEFLTKYKDTSRYFYNMISPVTYHP